MTVETLIPFAIGSFLCSLGLVHSKQRNKLILPQVVIPALIWLTLFLPIFGEPRNNFLVRARASHEATALWLSVAFITAFWIGYRFPINRLGFGGTLTYETVITWRSHTVQRLSIGGCIASQLIYWSARNDWIELPFHSFLTFLTTIGTSAMVGISWGLSNARRQGNPLLTRSIGIVIVLLETIPLAASFSRGSGLPAAVAVGAMTAIERKTRPSVIIALILWVLIAGTVGMTGRGKYGHYSGVEKYVTHLVDVESWLRPSKMAPLMLGASDSLTPLSLCLQANARNIDVQAMPVTEWLKLQIPVPSSLGLPRWSVYLPFALGATHRSEFNYTTGIYGDLVLHFGLFGPVWFVLIGLFYRYVNDIAFENQGRESAGGLIINWNLLFGVGTYYAFLIGAFNNFRSWNVMAIYLIFGSLLFSYVARRRTVRPTHTKASAFQA